MYICLEIVNQEFEDEGWFTLRLSQAKLSVGKCLHLQYSWRLVAMRVRFDVLPASIWLLDVNMLISVTIGHCNKKKQLLLVLLWHWHFKGAHM